MVEYLQIGIEHKHGFHSICLDGLEPKCRAVASGSVRFLPPRWELLFGEANRTDFVPVLRRSQEKTYTNSVMEREEKTAHWRSWHWGGATGQVVCGLCGVEVDRPP